MKCTAEYWNERPFMRWAGARILSVDNGVSRIALQVEDHHRGGADTNASAGIVNGAILAYLHDIAQSAAVRSMLGEDVKAIATLNLSISYISLMTCASLLYGEGRAIRVGLRIAFAESDFRNDQGDICCHATGTFHINRDSA